MSGLKIDRHPRRSSGIGDGIRARSADHRGARRRHHNGVVAIAAIQNAGAGATYDDVAVARADHALHRHIGIAAATLPGQKIDGYTGCSRRVGNGIRARAAEHGGARRRHHNGVVAIAAIQYAGAGATHDDVAVARANRALHRHIGVAAATLPGLKIDRHAGRSSDIRDGIRACSADHGGASRRHHNGVVAIATIQHTGAGTTHDDVAVARTDHALHGHIRAAVTARSGRQVDGHPGRSPGIGHGIRARTAEHGGARRRHHNGVVAIAAIQYAGAGAAHDDVAVARTDHALHGHIGAAVTA